MGLWTAVSSPWRVGGVGKNMLAFSISPPVSPVGTWGRNFIKRLLLLLGCLPWNLNDYFHLHLVPSGSNDLHLNINLIICGMPSLLQFIAGNPSILLWIYPPMLSHNPRYAFPPCLGVIYLNIPTTWLGFSSWVILLSSSPTLTLPG